MESPLAASPFPPLGSNQVSALGNLATSTTLDVPFPSLLPSLRVDPESTPALFTRPSSYGSRRVGERKGDGEYSKSPGAARHDGRDRVEIGLGHLFGFINRSLLHHLVNTNTTPKDSAFSSHLVDGLGCRAELDLADRPPLCPQIRASQRQFIPDGPFRTSHDKTVSPRRLHSFLEAQLVQVASVWFLGSQSVQGLCSPSALTGRSSRINAPHSPLSLARFGPRRF